MKTGIVTYVHGWYKDYIPFFIYSINKAYPSYEPRIYVREKLSKSVINNLKLIKTNYTIMENYLPNLGNRDDPSKKPYYLRWLLPESCFHGLDNAFICDVDLIMLKEEQSLVQQRLAICDRNNVPFANYERPHNKKYPPRITGWHFIRVEEYYQKTGNIIDELRKNDIDITKMKNKYMYKNGLGETQWGQESLLHHIIREAFGDIDISHTFPTHHGIHLGPLRAKLHERLYAGERFMTNRFGHNAKYWFSDQLVQYSNDSTFNMMIENTQESKVKLIMRRFMRDVVNDL